MRNLISTLLFFTSLIVSSQNTTKVTFENKPILSANQLQGMTEDVQKIVLKQLQATSVLSTMEIQGTSVYYQTKTQSQEKIGKGNGQSQNVGGKNSMLQDVTTTVEAPSKKILKNALKNTYTQLVEEKISTKALSKTIWETTKKTKKIAGYNCFEATGTYKDRIITIYYTKELNAKASPELLPFIDGVILEYNTGKRQGIAIKVEKNQPDVKDFFKK